MASLLSAVRARPWVYLGAAVLIGVGVYAAAVRGVKGGAFAALACFFFSADDTLMVHEHIRFSIFGLDEPGRVLWPIVYLPLAGTVLVILWRLSRRLPPIAARALVAGLACLVVAVGLEMVSLVMVNAGYPEGSRAYEVEVIFEEGLELAGWILIASSMAAGALALLERSPAARLRTVP